MRWMRITEEYNDRQVMLRMLESAEFANIQAGPEAGAFKWETDQGEIVLTSKAGNSLRLLFGDHGQLVGWK